MAMGPQEEDKINKPELKVKFQSFPILEIPQFLLGCIFMAYDNRAATILTTFSLCKIETILKTKNDWV